MEVIKEFANPTSGVSKRNDVLLAQGRFRDEVCRSIGEPGESVPLGNGTVGKFYGCFATRSYLRQVGYRDGVELLVDRCNTFAQPIDLRLQAADSTAPFLGRGPLDDCLNFPDRAFELP